MIELSELTELHLSAHSSCLIVDRGHYRWCSLIQFFLRPTPMNLGANCDEAGHDQLMSAEILGKRMDLKEVEVRVSHNCIGAIFTSSIMTYCLESFHV